MRSRSFTCLLLSLCLAGAPLTAEPAREMEILRNMVADLDHQDPWMQMNGALAACLAGEGDQYLTTSWFEDHGWKPRMDKDMGVVGMTRPGLDSLYAWVAEDGSRCQVWSQEMGTGQAFDILKELLSAAGVASQIVRGGWGRLRRDDLGCGKCRISGRSNLCRK